ncbi:MAG: glycosyltransferase family 4 protein [Anaerolineae bacterium]
MPEKLGSVLIIVENLPVPFDRRVWMECNTLRDAGYEVSVICPTGKQYTSLYEVIDEIHIYRHDLPPEESSVRGYLREYSSALSAQWRLTRKIHKERGFDVIHICNPPDLMFMISLPYKLFSGKRVIFDHHDLNPELYESKFNKRGLFYHLLKITERLTFMTANTVISTNESYKEVAMTRGKKSEKDIFVVRSGPDISRFIKVAPNPEYKHGKPYMIGYLGVMGEFDGVDHLVRAAAELINNRQRTDIQFCFIGSGPMLESLQNLSKELNITDYVEFTGRISDEDMIARLSSCDVCVDPDPLNPLNDKSTMNKILEYMALEQPIVQYDLTEGRRSAQNASLYAEPNNVADLATKIEELLANPEQRAEMGKLGRKRMVEELEWSYQKSKLLAAYRYTME